MSVFRGKFKSAYFEFKIKPEDSRFLKAWQELKNSKEFQKDYKTVKEKVEGFKKGGNTMK